MSTTMTDDILPSRRLGRPRRLLLTAAVLATALIATTHDILPSRRRRRGQALVRRSGHRRPPAPRPTPIHGTWEPASRHSAAPATSRAAPPSPATPAPRRRFRVLGEILLTVAALIGLAASGVTVLAARSGLEPLVVRSGSMEPTIETGAMILVRRIEASDITVGDVVSVQRPDRTRVTHRVVDVEHQGETAVLTLQGDANEDPDPVPVTVHEAQRLVWQVPFAGRAAAWFATAQGGFVLGSASTLALVGVFRRRGARGRSRGTTVRRPPSPAEHDPSSDHG